VLLVDSHEPQTAKGRALLHEGVRSDRQERLTGPQACVRLTAFLACQAPGDEHGRDA